MLEGYRRASIAVGLTLIAAFAIGGYILGHQLGEEVGKKDAHTKEYERHAADEINSTCLRLDPVAEAECIVRVMKTAHEHKRAERDLIAQRNMARWALLMLFATVAMAFITSAGVYYVWRTLVATQKMASDTRKIGEAQVRAYPSVKSITFQWKDERPSCIIKLSNAGNSPALKFNCTGEYHLNFLGDPNEENDQFSESLSVGMNPVAQIALNPGDAKIESDDSRTSDVQREDCIGKMSDALNNKKAHWTMTLRLQWTDVFGKKFGFYANAGENGRITSGQRNSGNWQSTFEITYQSESRERKES